MKTKLVAIGNSRGVRIPKALIDQCELGEEVELEVRGRQLVVRAAQRQRPRAGWEQAFEEMARRGDDELLDAEAVGEASEWDRKEWTW